MSQPTYEQLLGIIAEKDRQIAELQARVTQLEARLAQLEQLLDSGDSIEWRSVKAVVARANRVLEVGNRDLQYGRPLNGPPFGTAYYLDCELRNRVLRRPYFLRPRTEDEVIGDR